MQQFTPIKLGRANSTSWVVHPSNKFSQQGPFTVTFPLLGSPTELWISTLRDALQATVNTSKHKIIDNTIEVSTSQEKAVEDVKELLAELAKVNERYKSHFEAEQIEKKRKADLEAEMPLIIARMNDAITG